MMTAPSSMLKRTAGLATIASAALILALLPIAVLGSRPATPSAALQAILTPLPFCLLDPVYVGNAGDGCGRLFIVQRTGIIRIANNSTLVTTPFLSITDRVGSASSEQGLLSVAFPPSFGATQRFYVYYTDKIKAM